MISLPFCCARAWVGNAFVTWLKGAEGGRKAPAYRSLKSRRSCRAASPEERNEGLDGAETGCCSPPNLHPQNPVSCLHAGLGVPVPLGGTRTVVLGDPRARPAHPRATAISPSGEGRPAPLPVSESSGKTCSDLRAPPPRLPEYSRRVL